MSLINFFSSYFLTNFVYRYGFCERENIQNPRTKTVNTFAYCFLTDFAFQNFYYSILSFITKHGIWSRHKAEEQMNQFLDHILLQPISIIVSSQQSPYPQLVL